MIELSADQEERARKLHDESLVIDATSLDHVATKKRWFDQARSGGVDVVWVTTGGFAGISNTIRAVASALRFIEKNSQEAVQVRTSDEMRQAKKDGKMGILFAYYCRFSSRHINEIINTYFIFIKPVCADS